MSAAIETAATGPVVRPQGMGEGLRGDNRPPKIHFFDDLRSVMHMASLNVGEVERAFNPNRGKRQPNGSITFTFRDEGIDEALFVAQDIETRLRNLFVRANILFSDEETGN